MKSTIDKRVSMLQFAFNLAGVPFPPAAVKEVTDMAGARDLVTFLPLPGSDQPNRLAALVPWEIPTPPPMDTEARFVLHLTKCWPLFPAWQADNNFVQWWNRLGLGAVVEAQAAGEGGSDSASSGQASGQQPMEGDMPLADKTLAKHLENLTTTTSVLVREFIQRSAGSPKTKEKDFTPLMTKLLKLKQDSIETSSSGFVRKVEQVIDLVSACKKLMRPYKEFLRTRKVVNLAGIAPNLGAIMDYTARSGDTFGPIFGATCLRSLFWCASSNKSVEEAVALFHNPRLDWETRGSPPDCEKHNVISDCMTNYMYTELSNAVQRGSAAETDEAWTATKKKFAQAVGCFQTYAEEFHQRDSRAGDLVKLLQAIRTVCGAALGEGHISPSMLAEAIENIDTSDSAARVQEGFKHGVGAALMADAKLLLVSGELDAQCEEEYLEAAQNILGTGLEPLEGDSGWSVPADLCACQGDSLDMVHILSEGIGKLATVLTQWSLKNIAEEAGSIAELLDHMARHFVLYDAGKMTKMVRELGARRKEWADAFTKIQKGASWPPELSAGSMKAVGKMDDETPMGSLKAKVEVLCEKTLDKVIAMSDVVKSAAKVLEYEVRRYSKHAHLRKAMWQETKATSELLSLAFNGDSSEDMLQHWSSVGDGFLWKVLEISVMRPPAAEYLEPKVIDAKVKIVVEGLSEGYLVFGPGESLQVCIAQWLEGCGINCVIEAFLTPHLDGLAEAFHRSVNAGLGSLNLTTIMGAGDTEEGNAKLDLTDILPKDTVAELASQVANYDLKHDEHQDLPEYFKLPVCLMSEPFEALQSAGSDVHFRCSPCGPHPVHLSDLVPAFDLYKHMAGMLSVASFVHETFFKHPENLVLKPHGHARQGTAQPVAPARLFLSCMDLLDGAGKLEMKELCSGLEAIADKRVLFYKEADMITLAKHLSTTWPIAARRRAGEILSAELEKTTETLKMKTPGFSHIVTGTKYNSTLARKQLLNHGAVHSIGELIADAKILVSALEEALPAGDFEDNHAVMDREGVMQLAKTTLAVIAAIGAIEQPRSGNEAAEIAGRVLEDKHSGIPEALKSKLRSLTIT